MMFDPIFMAITGVSMLLSWLVGKRLQSKFAEYSQIPLPSGLSGAEVAEKMLADSGITDVKVISVGGQLTDHYNPGNRTVNLSEVVYGQRNVAAAAVAAHEVGHAVQHATAYRWLGFRSKMVPVVNISTKASQYVIMIGLGLAAASGGNPTILLIGICLFAMSTLFTIVTLPVEFDASKRALAWLKTANITGNTQPQAKDALKWAAMTYVVAALASIGQLLYWVMRYMAMSNRER